MGMMVIIFLWLSVLLGSVCSICVPYNCPPNILNITTLKSGAPNTFRLGYLGSTGSTSETMARWAVYDMNMNPTILPDTYMELYSINIVSQKELIAASLELITGSRVQALVIDLSEAETTMARIVSNYDIPVLSVSSTTEAYDSKAAEFNNLMARLSTPNFYQSNAMVQYLQHYNVTSFHYVYTNDQFGSIAYLTIKSIANSVNMSVIGVPIDQGSRPIPSESIINGRAIVLAQSDTVDGFAFAKALSAAGAYGPSYLYMLSLSMALAIAANGDNVEIRNGGILMLTLTTDRTYPYYISTLNAWKNSSTTQFPGSRSSVSPVVDAVRIFASTVHDLVAAGTLADEINGTILFEDMMAKPHPSLSGEFKFSSNFDKRGNFVIYNGNGANGQAQMVGTFDSTNNELTLTNPPLFYNGSTVNPMLVVRVSDICSFSICSYRGNCSSVGACVCEEPFYGVHCEFSSKSSSGMSKKDIIAVVVPVTVVIGAIFICTFLYLRRRRVQLMKEIQERQRSEISRNDIRLLERIGRGASGEVYKATFRGTEVAVKKLSTKNASKNTINEFMFEIAIMCGLRHPNIVLFMGSCMDAEVGNSDMLLVMELMQRGSLHDVLHNPKVALSYDLQLHLACQAAQGMAFLHASQPPIIHRDLKSHNILLDEKWNARISDFGITRFKEMNNTNKEKKNQSLGTIFWTSPEVLNSHGHSEKSDVYAFGVVLWELFHRQEPYVGKDVMVVALEVAGKGLRPTMDANCPPEIRDLIQQCWEQDPQKRPAFPEILDRLRMMIMANPHNPSTSSPIVSRVEAPTGLVFMVHAEVAHCATLWDSAPRAMQDALLLLKQFIHSTLESYGGYELETSPTSFLVSFPALVSAMNWCISTQVALMRLNWPSELLQVPVAGEMSADTGELLWRGLRLRMAIHTGSPYTEISASNGRVTYSGSLSETTKAILPQTSRGFIICTPEVMEGMLSRNDKFTETVTSASITTPSSKQLHLIYPESLAKRASPLPGQVSPAMLMQSVDDFAVGNVPLPNAVAADGTTVEEIFGPEPLRPKWMVTWKELEVKQSIGRGAIGDFSRADWAGKEVAVKVLVNQKLKTEDIIRLTADAAVLSKISHPNLVPFLGLCLDKNHISLINGFVAKGNLRTILSDAPPPPLAVKVKIALDVASGMDFLSSHPDRDVALHDNFKSHNVMIASDWTAMVTDYGQSNIKDLARTMTSVSNVGWTAPEILEGSSLTAQSGMYSFGIILWELWTRKMPYENEHPIRVVTKILSGYRPPIPVDCPAPYKSLIENCWNADPAQRPSWHVIQSELTHFLKSLK